MNNIKEKDNQYYDIVLTDIQSHAVKPRKPKPLSQVVSKSFRAGKPGRLYFDKFRLELVNDREIKFQLFLPPDIQKDVEKAKREGKIIRILAPKKGIPFCFGKDAVEKMKAEIKKRQRLLDN